MSVVVDASILVAATTDAGADGVWAERIIADGGLAAPHLVYVETANILGRLERAEQLTRLESTAAHEDMLGLDLEVFAYEPFAERIWQLRSNVSSYDAWYVAIAEALESPLATLNARLGRAPGLNCGFLLPN